jgi:hypothetical protein
MLILINYQPTTVIIGLKDSSTASTRKSIRDYILCYGHLLHFQALQQSNPAIELEQDTSTREQVTVQFGVGSASSIGTADVYTPIGKV